MTGRQRTVVDRWSGRWGLVLGAVLLALVIPGSAGATDCDDFDTQAEAQRYFDDHGGSRTTNVDTLDEDRDGIPCEHLADGDAVEPGFLRRAWLPLVGGVAVVGGGAAVAYVMRGRRSAPPVIDPEILLAQTPNPLTDPDLRGSWPETTPERRQEFEAMGEDGPAAYVLAPEWLDKEAWKTQEQGGACELCGTHAPLTLHLRSAERRYREQPADVLILCSACIELVGEPA